MTSIDIPSGVTEIGDAAFEGCSGLTSIDIPSGVTKIGDAAFSCCSGLKRIDIPSGVEKIGASAFTGCSGLTRIAIPSSVTEIGDSAFYDCSGLTSITISEGVEKIGGHAFGYCSKLTSIVIPSSVTTVGDMAFGDCNGLKEVYYPEKLAENSNNVPSAILEVAYTINEDNTVSLNVVYCPADTTTITLPEYFDNMTIKDISGADGIDVSDVSVLKKNAPNMPEKKMEVPYTTTKVSDILLNENWQWENKDISLTVGETVTATAVYIGDDIANYENTTVSVEITRLACKHDGETIPKSTTHTWDNGKVTKEPTATEAGEKTYTCSVCQTTKTEPVAATGDTENKGDENGNTENKGDENGNTENKGDENGNTENKGDENSNTENKGDENGNTENKGNENGNTENKGDENNNTGNQGSENNDAQIPAKGTTVTDKKSNAQYKVTASDKNGATVEYVKSLSKTAKVLKVPATVDVNGVTCKVTSIKKGAFKKQ